MEEIWVARLRKRWMVGVVEEEEDVIDLGIGNRQQSQGEKWQKKIKSQTSGSTYFTNHKKLRNMFLRTPIWGIMFKRKWKCFGFRFIQGKIY